MSHGTPENIKDVVRKGYDTVSLAYRADQASEECQREYAQWLGYLADSVPLRAEVLDLGCGCGVPAAQLLANRYSVTGVDISPVQIQRARRLVPRGQFICADMTSVAFAAKRFDAIVCLYALIHVPLDEQPGLLRRIAGWLQPGGLLLATVGHQAWTGTEMNWLGVPGAAMHWSHTDEATYLRWFETMCLHVRWHRFIPEGTGGHTLVLANKSGRGQS